MGQGDYMPSGGRHRKQISPAEAAKRAKALREGGQESRRVNSVSTHHHQTVEVPAANAQLDKDLIKVFGPDEEKETGQE